MLMSKFNIYINIIFPSLAVGFCRKLKKLLRRRKSDLDSKQEEELNKTLHRHEKDHFLGPFTGLSPEYMEMSESKHKAQTYTPCRLLFYRLLEVILTFGFSYFIMYLKIYIFI